MTFSIALAYDDDSDDDLSAGPSVMVSVETSRLNELLIHIYFNPDEGALSLFCSLACFFLLRTNLNIIYIWSIT